MACYYAPRLSQTHPSQRLYNHEMHARACLVWESIARGRSDPISRWGWQLVMNDGEIVIKHRLAHGRARVEPLILACCCCCWRRLDVVVMQSVGQVGWEFGGGSAPRRVGVRGLPATKWKTVVGYYWCEASRTRWVRTSPRSNAIQFHQINGIGRAWPLTPEVAERMEWVHGLRPAASATAGDVVSDVRMTGGSWTSGRRVRWRQLLLYFWHVSTAAVWWTLPSNSCQCSSLHYENMYFIRIKNK